jgi:hypothetical protein
VRYHRNGREFNESSQSDREAEAKKLLKTRLGEIALGRFAGQAEKLPSAPYVPSLTENNVRTGFFEYEEFGALRQALRTFTNLQ